MYAHCSAEGGCARTNQVRYLLSVQDAHRTFPAATSGCSGDGGFAEAAEAAVAAVAAVRIKNREVTFVIRSLFVED
jgi:hypothetical protein